MPFDEADKKTASNHYCTFNIQQIFENPIGVARLIKSDCLDMGNSSQRSMPSASVSMMQDYCLRNNKGALSEQQLNEIVAYVMMIARGQIKIQPKDSE